MTEITEKYIVTSLRGEGVKGYSVLHTGRHYGEKDDSRPWWSKPYLEVLPGKSEGVDSHLFVLENDQNYDGCGNDKVRIVGVAENTEELKEKMFEYVQQRGRQLASGPESELVMKVGEIKGGLRKCKEISTVNTRFEIDA